MELKNDSLPQPFLRKLTKRAEDEARKCIVSPAPDDACESKSEGSHPPAQRADATRRATTPRERSYPALTALRVVMDVVQNNKLLPCWKEMRQAIMLTTNRWVPDRVPFSLSFAIPISGVGGLPGRIPH